MSEAQRQKFVMCGIIGGFGVHGLKAGDITAALDSIKHRGPDDSGLEVFGSTFVGMRRLAIIDTVGGHQPLANEDSSVWVVLNGEIYNYVELMKELKAKGHFFTTDSDTEVLVHLYEEMGEKLVERLRGMFAFCVLDKKRNRMLLARDRFGKKPLYYTRATGGTALFASEIKALRVLMKAVGLPCNIEPQAIYDYLSLGVIPQPETIFKGVLCLPPASAMWLEQAEAQPKEYWTFKSDKTQHIRDDELYERVRHEIRESVQIRLRSDVPLGILLSGGLDSSIVAFEAARELGESLQTFTVAACGGELDESPVAANTAKLLKVRNTILPMEVAPVEAVQFLARHYDQPFAEPSAIPTYAVCKLARQHVTVVLNGDGGDELFGGYRRHLAAWRAGTINWLPPGFFNLGASVLKGLNARRRSSFGFLQRFLRGLSLDGADRYLIWTTDMLRESDKTDVWRGPPTRSTEEFVSVRIGGGRSVVGQIMEGDRNINLLSALLVKMDMASMAASLEARSPFLDHVVAELAAGIDYAQFFRGGKTKALLRSAYRGRLSSEVLDGAKRGFEIPLADWLRKELKPLLMDTVCAPNARLTDYLDANFVRDIVHERLMKDRNWAYVTYSLLMLELWLGGEAYERGAVAPG